MRLQPMRLLLCGTAAPSFAASSHCCAFHQAQRLIDFECLHATSTALLQVTQTNHPPSTSRVLSMLILCLACGRIKELKGPRPHRQEDAEKAGNVGAPDNGPRLRSASAVPAAMDQ